ncbi:MAG: hypothetical protein HY751_02585 [Nitrospinae bacterium]|nr:hypothetical protein [Nitrospinota bacterium]
MECYKGVLITPSFKLVKTADQAITGMTTTTVTWQAAEIDNMSKADLANSRYVIPFDGLYFFNAEWKIAANPVPGDAYAFILVNGVIKGQGRTNVQAGATLSYPMASTLVSCNKGDFITMQVFANLAATVLQDASTTFLAGFQVS